MKCPKCSYLGFETGDRCKNCGYDFSLLAAPQPPDPDLSIQVPDEMPAGADVTWMDRLHSRVEDVAEAHEMPEPALAGVSSSTTLEPPVQAQPQPAFPLFTPRVEEDDEPLIKMPAAPRPPLSVRRASELPRIHPRPARADDRGLSLEFADETLIAPGTSLRGHIEYETIDRDAIERDRIERDTLDTASARIDAPADNEISSLPRRAAAGLVDHLILFGIDLVVLYSTLRMAGLTMGDWQLLPAAPMLAFLVLLKLSYFGVFTAACGQTIGKMAAHIRVVADGAPLDPGRAARRTLVGAVSLLAFGAGFIPALLDPDRRALHDRVARTRVVELPST